MLMKKEVVNIPVLRFPEFNDAWKNKPAGELFANSRKKGDENLPIYSVTQDRGLVRRDSLDRKMADDASPDKNLYVGKGYLAYNMMRMWQGAVGLASDDGMVSPAYIVLKPRPNTSSVFFINHFQRSRSLYLLWAYSYGLTNDRLRLYYKDFAQIRFLAPSLPEQQKIASFLAALDKKIEQLTRKKELLEQYKKGVMQKIFSQEIRFKDNNGLDYPDWREMELAALGRTFGGLSGKSAEDFGKGFPFVTYKQVFDYHRINVTQFQYVKVADTERQSLVKYGDVFFTTSSETPLEVGYSSVLLNKVERLYLNSFCFGYRINSHEILLPEYACYLFRNADFRKKVIKLAQGSTRYNISKKEMMQLSIQIPSKREQQKIAVFLLSIDTKINTVQSQIIQTQNFKKGLLKKMFV